MIIRTNSSRRRFISNGVGASIALGINSKIPDVLLHAAEHSKKSDRILVFVQLTGGNDGLNTVIPYRDENYEKARPKLALSSSQRMEIDDSLALHQSLSGFEALMQKGLATIVQGVGYDSPNRSHFESMDIWHTCLRKNEARTEGWLGKYLDQYASKNGGNVPALHLGNRQQPSALMSRNVRVPSINALEEFQLSNDSELLRSLLHEATAIQRSQANDLLGFVQTSTTSAIVASDRVTEASGKYESNIDYPDSRLGTQLKTVAQLIDAGMKTQIYYVELDGFDTHAKQAQAHATLLKEWSDAVSAFTSDMHTKEHGERICVVSFSEFGRRVAENASEGTDHGAAAPMFLCGGGLGSSVVGDFPSLTDLNDGDLKHAIDFRSVYATLLDQWLGIDAETILGNDYSQLDLFSA